MSQQPLFGLVPAGQPVIVTPTEAPTPTSFLFAIPPSASQTKPFSHITVFLLPGVVLPEGTAAAIYLVTPPSGPNQTQPNSKFLGGIGPGKESAIFKLGGASAAPHDGGAGTSSTSRSNVVIGISVEPADSVAARIGEIGSSGNSGALVPLGAGKQQPSTLVLAQRIIKNAFNFLASFSGTAGQVEVVPLRAFEEWWRKFESRVRSDPGFLERDE
ncbi:Hikeshi-like domain-containing protein [Madurella fahalii]|uniref:Hikeshi-like domain-containing protein n=1 Tax=Madurella fahalii TaxID=1157608 RepID=A0ABQ0GMP3_9PEZI